MKKIKPILSKVFDYTLFYLSGAAALHFLPFGEEEDLFCFGILVPLLWIPIESLLLRFWGTTPGRRLIGQRIKNLSLKEAFKRACLFGKDGKVEEVGMKGSRIMLSLFLLLSTFSAVKWHDDIKVFLHLSAPALSHPFYSEQGNFRVYFPNEPVYVLQELELQRLSYKASYHEYRTEVAENAFYAVSYMHFPRKWRMIGTNSLLNKALDLLIETEAGAQLLEKKRITHQKHPAIDFTYTQGGAVIQGRLILIGTTLYKLTSSHTEAAEQEKVFLDSFHFIG